MTSRIVIVLAAVVLFVAVGTGAFGAHALKTRLGSEALAVWQTAVQYHFWHGLGLLAVGLLMINQPDSVALAVAAALFVAGIVLFSGSLYALAFTGTKWFGAVTPFGGLAFLGGWAVLAFAAWQW